MKLYIKLIILFFVLLVGCSTTRHHKLRGNHHGKNLDKCPNFEKSNKVGW